ncbi:MAG: PEGA domain-containing protein, partial [bacterium]
YNSDIPSELEQIVKKTLEKQTDKRYASMQELLNDLRKYQSSLKAETQDLVETIPQRDVLTQEKGATTEGEIFTGYKPSDDEKKTQVVRPPTKRQIKTLPKTSRQKLALAAVLVLVVSILTITVFMNIRKEHIPEVGYIDLISNPPGALISVNGEPTGQTTPQKIGPLKKGTYEVVLTLEGFESWSKDFSITKNDTLAQTIQLVPTTGTSGNLVVKSDPAEASVYLDLKDTGLKTPVTLQNLSQGLHTVQLKKEGYQTVEQSIDIASEKTEEWSVELTRAVGSLSIDSNPRGASVFLKGKSTGKKTPAVFRNMDVGSYEVQLKKEGYQTFESFVKISAEKTTNISGSLRKAAKKTTGKLTGSLLVDSDPQGALVYLNGKSTGQKTPYLFTGLDAGHYEVRLSLPGFSDNMTEVAVKPNEENKINLGLQEEPRGRLNVTAVILENNTQRTAIANIFVEGQSYGQTPKIISLKGGTYKISAKLFGYTAKSGERQIKIQGGKETTLKFEFVKN